MAPGFLHSQPIEEEKPPGVSVALTLIGWLSVGGGLLTVALAIFLGVQGEGAPVPTILALGFGGTAGGVLFLAAAAVVRSLHEIEVAMRRNRV